LKINSKTERAYNEMS